MSEELVVAEGFASSNVDDVVLNVDLEPDGTGIYVSHVLAADGRAGMVWLEYDRPGHVKKGKWVRIVGVARGGGSIYQLLSAEAMLAHLFDRIFGPSKWKHPTIEPIRKNHTWLGGVGPKIVSSGRE